MSFWFQLAILAMLILVVSSSSYNERAARSRQHFTGPRRLPSSPVSSPPSRNDEVNSHSRIQTILNEWDDINTQNEPLIITDDDSLHTLNLDQKGDIRVQNDFDGYDEFKDSDSALNDDINSLSISSTDQDTLRRTGTEESADSSFGSSVGSIDLSRALSPASVGSVDYSRVFSPASLTSEGDRSTVSRYPVRPDIRTLPSNHGIPVDYSTIQNPDSSSFTSLNSRPSTPGFEEKKNEMDMSDEEYEFRGLAGERYV